MITVAAGPDPDPIRITISRERVAEDTHQYQNVFTGLLTLTEDAVAEDGFAVGYGNRHYPAEAARLAGHILRYWYLGLAENDRRDWMSGGLHTGILDPEVADALNRTANNDERFAIGMALVRGLAGTHDQQAEGVRALGKWLIKPQTAGAGHLVRFLAQQYATINRSNPNDGDLHIRTLARRAFWRLHGRAILEGLAAADDSAAAPTDDSGSQAPARGGRPTLAEAGQRELLRRATIRTWQAHRTESTKARLAQWAAVSRPTLDAWLREAAST